MNRLLLCLTITLAATSNTAHSAPAGKAGDVTVEAVRNAEQQNNPHDPEANFVADSANLPEATLALARIYRQRHDRILHEVGEKKIQGESVKLARETASALGYCPGGMIKSMLMLRDNEPVNWKYRVVYLACLPAPKPAPDLVWEHKECLDSMTKHAAPVYPPDAIHLDLQGWIVISFALDGSGKATEITVEDSDPPGDVFDESATQSLERTEFRKGVVQPECVTLVQYKLED